MSTVQLSSWFVAGCCGVGVVCLWCWFKIKHKCKFEFWKFLLLKVSEKTEKDISIKNFQQKNTKFQAILTAKKKLYWEKHINVSLIKDKLQLWMVQWVLIFYLLNSWNGPYSTLGLQALLPNLTFFASNLKSSSKKRLLVIFDLINHSLPYVCFYSWFSPFSHFGLFSLIKGTFLDPKLMDIHKLLSLHHFRSRFGHFLIQGSQKTKKNKVSGNTTYLSTSQERISF